MSTKNADFKINNGSGWDNYHFKTNSGQVAHTTEDGEQTTVEDELKRQNSNFDIFANGGENSDGKALRIDTAIMQGKNLLYECWGPSFFPYGSNTTGAPTAWPGLMLAFVLPYGSEGWTRHVKYAFELSGDIYYMTYKNGIIDKNWTKIAGPA